MRRPKVRELNLTCDKPTLFCSGEAVRRVLLTDKNDPKRARGKAGGVRARLCLACRAYLSRSGIRAVDLPATPPQEAPRA